MLRGDPTCDPPRIVGSPEQNAGDVAQARDDAAVGEELPDRVEPVALDGPAPEDLMAIPALGDLGLREAEPLGDVGTGVARSDCLGDRAVFPLRAEYTLAAVHDPVPIGSGSTSPKAPPEFRCRLLPPVRPSRRGSRRDRTVRGTPPA